MQLQLMDEQVQYLLTLAAAHAEDATLQSVAGTLNECIASLTDETDEKYRAAARDEYEHEGDCEIDDGAPVSKGGDPGAYVQAWVWVSNSEAGIVSDGEAEDAVDDTEEDDDKCRQCGDRYAHDGDGWDGLCPSCADKAEAAEAAGEDAAEEAEEEEDDKNNDD